MIKGHQMLNKRKIFYHKDWQKAHPELLFLEKIHCPFCGKIMDYDIHPPEMFKPSCDADNWNCWGCEVANTDVCLVARDFIELIDVYSTHHDSDGNVTSKGYPEKRNLLVKYYDYKED